MHRAGLTHTPDLPAELVHVFGVEVDGDCGEDGEEEEKDEEEEEEEEDKEEEELGENLLVSESRKLMKESEYQIKVARVRSFPLQDKWQQSEKSEQTQEPELIKDMVRN